MNRREFLTASAAGVLATTTRADEPYRPKYAVASCLYGQLALAEVIAQVPRSEAEYIDIWPRVHGRQREQMDELGFDAVEELLKKHRVKIGIITRYDLGWAKLSPEFAVAKRFGTGVIVTGSGGPKGLSGDALKSAIKAMCEKMKPILEQGDKHGVTVAIENHANSLIDTPDSLRWLNEAAPSARLGVALAPYHLPQEPQLLAQLIRDLGTRLTVFYAWQHGNGSSKAQPKEDEMKQLPGRGSLDFGPALAALKATKFQGFTEIFMHSFPRGTPMLEQPIDVTAELVRVRRQYLEPRLK